MIHIIRGELAATNAEAVLRPVSAEWTAVTPATRRLEIAAGPEVERQCRTLGELPVPKAVNALTSGIATLPASAAARPIASTS